VGERALGREPAHHAVDVIAAPTDEVECGRVLVRRTVEVRTAAQHVDRPARDVYLVDVRHHQRAPAFGGGGAIEEMERVGDRP
jgi:hypothetical protein